MVAIPIHYNPPVSDFPLAPAFLEPVYVSPSNRCIPKATIVSLIDKIGNKIRFYVSRSTVKFDKNVADRMCTALMLPLSRYDVFTKFQSVTVKATMLVHCARMIARSEQF